MTLSWVAEIITIMGGVLLANSNTMAPNIANKQRHWLYKIPAESCLLLCVFQITNVSRTSDWPRPLWTALTRLTWLCSSLSRVSGPDGQSQHKFWILMLQYYSWILLCFTWIPAFLCPRGLDPPGCISLKTNNLSKAFICTFVSLRIYINTLINIQTSNVVSSALWKTK